jgi:hypothetical protein
MYNYKDVTPRQKKTLSKMKCVFWFSMQLMYERFLIISIAERDIIENVNCLSRKVPIILVQM